MSVLIVVSADTPPMFRMLDRMQWRVSPIGLRNWLRWTVHEYLVHRISDRFDSEGDDVSGKWAELASNTGRIRGSQGFPAFHPINVRTGSMRRQLESNYAINAQGTQITIPGRMSPKLKSQLSIAQKGGQAKNPASRFIGPVRFAPARPVLGLNALDAAFVTNSLMEYIKLGMVP